MKTDLRNGLAALCLAGLLGLLWLSTQANDDEVSERLRSSLSGGAVILGLIGLFLLTKALLARRD